MRGAGSTYNDIVDRDLDARVERTRGAPAALRPGERSQGAVAFLAAAVPRRPRGPAAVQRLRDRCTGFASLGSWRLYPFMKRLIWMPQIVLGLAFAWGALMGWAAAFGAPRPRRPLLLYARRDRLGRRLRHHLRPAGHRGRRDRRDQVLGPVVRRARADRGRGRCYALAVALVALGLALARQRRRRSAYSARGGVRGPSRLAGARIDRATAPGALRLFRSNRDAGLILFAGLAAAAFVHAGG